MRGKVVEGLVWLVLVLAALSVPWFVGWTLAQHSPPGDVSFDPSTAGQEFEEELD